MRDAASTLESLRILAGPIGPLGGESSREALRHSVVDGEPSAAASGILDALALLDGEARTESEAIEGEATDLLAELAWDHAVAGLLLEAVGRPASRNAALDALALGAAPDDMAPLTSEVANAVGTGWTERNVIKLASALGHLGTPDAHAALVELRDAKLWPPAVEREIAIALDGLAEPGRHGDTDDRRE